ncbi:hypothetical protein R1sor_019479 [Riccia sorocarpa]|uniref:Endonuclease/exonuclease/phosphatase domain-containing protein n=1 Tax=Riccia sorocarpa TaxID=122646 RepID=A0ABD3IGW8_9MARC
MNPGIVPGFMLNPKASSDRTADLQNRRFHKIGTVWNTKKFSKGRGFGGIAVFLRERSGIDVTIVHEDARKQFLVLQIREGNSFAFICAAYLAPWGSPAYAKLEEGTDPMLEITKVLLHFRNRGPVFVLGDFNSRSGVCQGEGWVEAGNSSWRDPEATDDWTRTSEDEGSTRLTRSFLQFINVCGLMILNGTRFFPLTGTYTCNTNNEQSVVDYLMVTEDARNRVIEFSFEPFLPESDHRPLLCTLSGFTRVHARSQTAQEHHVVWDAELQKKYSLRLSELTGDTEPSAGDVVRLVKQVEKEVFSFRVGLRTTWFDQECKEARSQALLAIEDHRANAFKQYNQLIKTKKRAFLRTCQLTLTEELKKDPTLFWKRLRSSKLPTELCNSDLREYVSQLYFFPNAGVMSPVGEVACLFTEAEVARELTCLNSGKALDLDGM